MACRPHPQWPRAAIEGGRGKVKIETQTGAYREHVPRPIPDGAVGSEKGSWPSWWLDISSPTYADMKALGKVPFLFCTTAIPYLTSSLAASPSPLTLEDILHQDPREKMVHASPSLFQPSFFDHVLGTVPETRILLHSVQGH
jgi:Mg2+ and Co2+ transporter CorA